jgi:hypothetical protein
VIAVGGQTVLINQMLVDMAIAVNSLWQAMTSQSALTIPRRSCRGQTARKIGIIVESPAELVSDFRISIFGFKPFHRTPRLRSTCCACSLKPAI